MGGRYQAVEKLEMGLPFSLWLDCHSYCYNIKKQNKNMTLCVCVCVKNKRLVSIKKALLCGKETFLRMLHIMSLKATVT